MNGNMMGSAVSEPDLADWQLYILPYADDAPLPDDYRRTAPLASAPISEVIQSAADAYASVVSDVGSNRRLDCAGKWVTNLDNIDSRIISQVRNNTGSSTIAESEDDLGGFPQIESAVACPDADHDGMPDQWENSYGFSPHFAGDNSADADGDGYTNIEEYLNGTNPREAQR
jgi:hypothetical protein